MKKQTLYALGIVTLIGINACGGSPSPMQPPQLTATGVLLEPTIAIETADERRAALKVLSLYSSQPEAQHQPWCASFSGLPCNCVVGPAPRDTTRTRRSGARGGMVQYELDSVYHWHWFGTGTGWQQ